MKRVLILIACLWPLLADAQDTHSLLGSMHSVSKGETWESVAADHGVSVAELQAANPDITSRKLKKRTLLIIPQRPRTQEAAEETPMQTEAQPETQIRTSMPHLKVGVLLPFADDKTRMAELYRGLLMAADSVRRSGTDIDIYAWDSGTTTAQVEQLRQQVTGLDVLFGPTVATQIPAVAEMCREQGIRLVLPSAGGQILQDYPLVYNATTPHTIVCEEAVRKMSDIFPNCNYVAVSSDTPDGQGQVLCEALTASLNQQARSVANIALEGDDAALKSALSPSLTNCIVLNDASIRSLNILLARLKDFRHQNPGYRIALIGLPEWQATTQTLLKDFFSFDTYIISPYYYNVLDEAVKRFQRTYEDAFHAPVAQGYPRYAALGFDLGFYFMQGISRQGDTFEQMQGSLPQTPYQNRFQFERTPSGMSFTNRFVQFIHFTPEEKIELIQ